MLFGFAATDIDECQTDNGQCEQICVNLPGSFSCVCYDGYQLENDGKRCRRSKMLHCQVLDINGNVSDSSRLATNESSKLPVGPSSVLYKQFL